MPASVDISSKLLAKIQGQKMHVPPLEHLYSYWHQGTNPHVYELLPLVEEVLIKYVPAKEHLKHALASAYSYFAASCYPDCDLERLQFSVLYAIFLFFWDDNIDREEGSSQPELANNIHLGTKYRLEAAAYVNWHLGFKPEGAPEPEYENPQLEIFGKAAKILRREADKDTLTRFRDEILFYIKCCQREQEDRLTGKFPSVQSYWTARLGTSSLYTFCALSPYILNTSFPQILLDSQEMRNCWMEVNKNVVFENDILSFKKEIADGAATTLIPVLMHENQISMNEAVRRSAMDLEKCCERFNAAAAALRNKAKGFSTKVQEDVEQLIESYETIQTGCFCWSMNTGRYGVRADRQKDGSLHVQL